MKYLIAILLIFLPSVALAGTINPPKNPYEEAMVKDYYRRIALQPKVAPRYCHTIYSKLFYPTYKQVICK